MYLDSNTIITASAIVTAMITIGGVALAIVKWVFRQQQQDEDIKNIKKEMCLLTYGVKACLQGLQEQGCNGPVTEAINKLDKHLNETAHDQT